jgi:hypothetical protein
MVVASDQFRRHDAIFEQEKWALASQDRPVGRRSLACSDAAPAFGALKPRRDQCRERFCPSPSP